MNKYITLLSTWAVVTQARFLKGAVNFPEDMSANPDYEYMRQLGISPEVEFDLMVKHGLDPRKGMIDLHGFSGEVQIEAMTEALENDEEREASLLSICTAIERLFTGEIFCTCNNPLLALGVIEFDCSYAREIGRREISYTPSFQGAFVYRIFAMQYGFTGSACGDGFRYYTQSLDLDLLIGDVCFVYDLIASFSRETGLTVGLAGCSVVFGFFGKCSTCTPCTTPNGGLGIDLDCELLNDNGAGFCIPLALPFSRSSGRVDGATIFDMVDFTNLFKAAEAKAIADRAAASNGKGNNNAITTVTPPVQAPIGQPPAQAPVSQSKNKKDKNNGTTTTTTTTTTTSSSSSTSSTNSPPNIDDMAPNRRPNTDINDVTPVVSNNGDSPDSTVASNPTFWDKAKNFLNGLLN